MSQFAQVLTALEAAKPKCAWMVHAAYDTRYSAGDMVEGPMEWEQADKRQSDLRRDMPGRMVNVYFDVNQLS